MQAQIGVMVGWLMASQQEPSQMYKVGLQANHLLEGLAEVMIGWQLLRHADVAQSRLPEAGAADADFYTGKIASAKCNKRYKKGH